MESQSKQVGRQEYVYYLALTNELITLFNEPTEGHEVYDLSVEGNVVIMDLHYIGEL